MIEINGYQQIPYTEFQKQLGNSFEQSKKSPVQIASSIKVKSAATIKNALNRETQVVSDEVLTAVMKAVSFFGIVVWVSGKKYYYVKNN